MEPIIVWNANPELIRFGSIAIRWYGLLFATAFLLGTVIISRIFKAENKPQETVDRLLLYMLLAIVLGSRLGEVIFYNPSFYFNNPIEIFKIWKGGLASHGALIGVLLGILIYVKRTPDQPFLWVMDRLMIAVASGGALIRIGNFFNSEIIGKPTQGNWGIIFRRIDNIPRHPAQLYESLTYFAIFIVLVILYRTVDTTQKQGLLFGIFLSVGFTARFFIEFIKEHQVQFEAGWTLNMGQRLSLPVIFLGLFTLGRLIFQQKTTKTKPQRKKRKRKKR